MLAVAVDFTGPAALENYVDRIQQQLGLVLERLIRADKLSPDFLRVADQIGTVRVEIMITNAQSVRQLNKLHRSVDEPTDVLSFENEHKSPAQLGSIVICEEIAAKQAKSAGVGLEIELQTLATHGLLHLLGAQHT